MATNEDEELELRAEIQKTLTSINDVTLRIRHELDMINELVKKDGQLETSVVHANETLSSVATEMGINVMQIMNENGEGPGMPNFPTTVSDSFINDALSRLES